MRRFSRCSLVLVLLPLSLVASRRAAIAQIITDGTLGPGGALIGPNYNITSDLGQIRGKNLFHSFQDFNLFSGESATFSGPASISNILSRVTGGNPSTLDGSINSTIRGANFFFINPSGIVFGPNAQVDVGGSFVATTANVVNLKDGKSFKALKTAPTDLTSAPPSSFGFLNSQPTPILVDGAFLAVGKSKALSLIGGDVILNNAVLAAEKGHVNLVATGSKGTVSFDTTSLVAEPHLTGFSKLGLVLMDTSLVDVSDLTADFSAGVGGSVNVNAKDLILDHSSQVFGGNLGNTSGGKIGIALTGSLQLQNQSSILAQNGGGGIGTAIQVDASNITLEGPVTLGPRGLTGIASVVNPDGLGKGGNIQLHSKSLLLLHGARIDANTLGQGNGGDLEIVADHITLDGQNAADITAIASQTLADNHGGKGGSVTVNAGDLQIRNVAEISASSNGSGAGGDLHINANKIILDGGNSPFFTGLIAGTFAPAGGAGGSIDVQAKSLQIVNSAGINVDTQGRGDGGNIHITADDITIDGRGSSEPTNISARTSFGPQGGRGGSIFVAAKKLNVIDGGQITASTSGSGAGGSINLTADQMTFDRKGSSNPTGISANTVSETKSSRGGNIVLNSRNILVLNGATIAAFTIGGGAGGNVTVNADNCTVNGHNGDFFTGFSTQTDADFGGGKGGSIKVASKRLTLVDGGQISSSSYGDGQGGSILIQADDIVLDGRNHGGFTGIDSGTFSLDRDGNQNIGNGGSIRIVTQNLRVLGGASVLADTQGTGNGGDITVRAASILLDGQNTLTGIASDSKSTGDGGNGGFIDIQARDLKMVKGGSISSGTLGGGNSGTIQVAADNIVLDRQGSSVSTTIAAESGGAGSSGSITINAKKLSILDGAEISANTFADGTGGDINITADDLTLDGQNSPFATTITAGTKDPLVGKKGGDIQIKSGHLIIANQGLISASSLGKGEGGDIVINAGALTLDNGSINSQSRGIGNAGSVNIDVTGLVNIGRVSDITITSDQSNGGDLKLHANGSIYVTNSKISGDATKDGGNLQLSAGKFIVIQESSLNASAGNNGGNLTSDARYVIFDLSDVLARAIHGQGGNIQINAKVFFPSNESVIDASSLYGVAGNVAINSPNTNLGGSLIVLPSNLLGAENYLATRCVIRGTGASSSFSVEPLNGAPNQPGNLLPSPTAPR